MANVLAKIVEDKRVEVEARKQAFPLAGFKNELTPSAKDMYAALTRTTDKPYAGFILECKKASPSKGLIREDFDPVEICQIYNQYAAAISVLTDEKYFQGTYEYLQQVTSKVDCPVLNKDFFIDPYQVYLARYYGADAILLMLSVLNDDEYRELAEIAESLNLAILTEISNDEEKERAVQLGAKMIGINNRNLRDLSTDISRTLDFAPSLPDNVIVISESGIYTNEQVRELAPAVDGFLVGSSIMAQDDINLACRTLIFGHNKVCGLMSTQAAQDAKDAGAVYGGLIFAEKSPRFVTLEQAQKVTSTQALNFIGVFVNAPISQVIDYASTLNLYAVQLHGNENEDYRKELMSALKSTNSNCQIWQAQAVIEEVPELVPDAEHIVLDGKNAGSGESFGWQALAESEQELSRCFLAGGLNSDNIESALLQVSEQQLFGLDLNSGVESQPGVKCREKLNTVFAQIRNY